MGLGEWIERAKQLGARISELGDMGQILRIEEPGKVNFLTTRTRASRLWFLHNKKLTNDILGALGKYAQKHSVTLYAFNLQGNHHHTLTQFSEPNRAAFMRDFNSRITFLARLRIPELDAGGFWGRRYASQVVPFNSDIERRFFYCALQSVLAGLVEHLRDELAYNSFHDAVCGIERKVEVINWTRYNNAKRCNPQVSITNYTEVYTIKYARLPGYENLSQKEYKNLMYKKLDALRLEAVRKRYAEGKGFLGWEGLRKIRPGARPLKTKTSTRNSKRLHVLTSCRATRRKIRSDYQEVVVQHRAAVAQYFAGNLTVTFPVGTYRPPWITPFQTSG